MSSSSKGLRVSIHTEAFSCCSTLQSVGEMYVVMSISWWPLLHDASTACAGCALLGNCNALVHVECWPPTTLLLMPSPLLGNGSLADRFLKAILLLLWEARCADGALSIRCRCRCGVLPNSVEDIVAPLRWRVVAVVLSPLLPELLTYCSLRSVMGLLQQILRLENQQQEKSKLTDACIIKYFQTSLGKCYMQHHT